MLVNTIQKGIVIDHITAGQGAKIIEYLGIDTTVNTIENGEVVKKIILKLPEKVVNVIKCKNPRCVTSVETNAPHIFHLIDEANKEYRCEYCDDIVSMKEGSQNEIMH